MGVNAGVETRPDGQVVCERCCKPTTALGTFPVPGKLDEPKVETRRRARPPQTQSIGFKTTKTVGEPQGGFFERAMLCSISECVSGLAHRSLGGMSTRRAKMVFFPSVAGARTASEDELYCAAIVQL